MLILTASFTHELSRKNLLGEKPDAKLLHDLSNDTQVTPQTPPTFLVHGDADTGVSPENSVAFYRALRKAWVSAQVSSP
jgi:dipeptidyl aminopeptidase/acylaminoacyl peptidase